jgi:hypothetical protein
MALGADTGAGHSRPERGCVGKPSRSSSDTVRALDHPGASLAADMLRLVFPTQRRPCQGRAGRLLWDARLE